MDNLTVIKVVHQTPRKELERLDKDSTSDISQCGQLVNHYLQGKICKRFQLCPYKGKGKLLKIILEDDAGKINVFCLDDYACDVDKSCAVGDTLIITNAIVETSPHYHRDGINKYHLMVGKRDQPCNVWVIPQLSNATGGDRHQTNQASSTHSDNQPGTSNNNTVNTSAKNRSSSKKRSQSSSSADNQLRNSSATNMASETNQASSTGRDNQIETSRNPSARNRTSPRKSSQETSTRSSNSPSTTSNLQQQQQQQQQSQTGNDTPVTRSPAGTQATQNKSPTKRSYLYTNLSDVKETNSVNVYGIVKFFKPPRKTRGTDYFMALTLIDPSLTPDQSHPDMIDSGLKCNLFRRELKALPQVLRVGDIVRLHRIKVQRYRNELQAMCTPGFAALVFDGRMGMPLKPRSSSADFTVTQEDKDKVRELQRWVNTVMQSDGLSNDGRYLSDVFIGQYFNLMCQVVAKALLPSESCVLLKVWDGTKCSWPVRQIDVAGRPIEWDTTAAFRAEGLTVDVCLYDDHVPAGDKIQPGDYICLYNLHALKYVQPGEVETFPVSMGEFCLHRGTSYGRGVTVMSQYDPDVMKLIRKLDDVNRTGVPGSSTSTQQQSAHGTSTTTQQQSAHGASTTTQQQSAQGASTTTQQQSAQGASTTTRQQSAQGASGQSLTSTDDTQQETRSEQVASATRRLQFSRAANQSPERPGGSRGLQASPGRPSGGRGVQESSDRPGRARGVQASNGRPGGGRSVVSRGVDSERGQQSNHASSSHCMQHSASIITDHVHIKISSIAEVKARHEAHLFRVRARVADFRPNNVADFVILFCPKCRFRCKVPHQQRASSEDDGVDASEDAGPSGRETRSRRKRTGASAGGTSEDETSRRQSPRRKGTRLASSDTSDNKQLPRKIRKTRADDIARQQEVDDSNRSPRKVAVVHPSNMRKTLSARGRVKGHNATAELENETSTRVKVTIEDLSVQDALLLAHQGVKLQGYTHNVDSNTGHQDDQSTPVYYVCPRCSPINRSRTNEDETDDTASLLQYLYCIKLFLQDDSGRIPVIVTGKHAETFFEDIAAVNLHENLDSKFSLEDYMSKLCPYPLEQSSASDDGDNSHPWLDACIMSYPAEVRGQETMKYHLFHTVLALDVE